VASLIERQYQLLNDGNFAALFELLSPQARASCSYEAFESYWRDVIELGGEYIEAETVSFSVSEVEVSVEGDVADASYTVQVDGEEFYSEDADDPDRWIRVDGRWYDEDEEACY